jgi:hypothetical protein
MITAIIVFVLMQSDYSPGLIGTVITSGFELLCWTLALESLLKDEQETPHGNLD